MRKYLLAFLAFATIAWAANIKLYLKDGGYHIVREYKVEKDRVRFYSIERGDWEEMPLDLIDLKRTETEAAERKAELEKDAKKSGRSTGELRLSLIRRFDLWFEEQSQAAKSTTSSLINSPAPAGPGVN